MVWACLTDGSPKRTFEKMHKIELYNGFYVKTLKDQSVSSKYI